MSKVKKEKGLLEFVKKGGRVFIYMNTGTRIHKAKKGKGSYKRNNKVRS